jgi:ABC-type transporter Mla subunit MlaD
VALLAGFITVALIGGFIYIAETSYNGLPFVNYRYLEVSLPNVGHLQEHDPVDIAGVRVGQVLGESVSNNKAEIKLQLQGVGPIPVDSRVVIRADGLLGERYAQLDLGRSSRTLPNGGTIVEGGGTYYNGIPETLNLFDQQTRTALGEMLNGLGEGVTGRGQGLNQAISVGPSSGADFDTAVNAILARPGAAARFLPDVNSGLGALDQARNDLARMLGPTSTALRPLQTEKTPTQNAIAETPAVEQAVDAGLSAPATKLLTAVDLVARNANAVLPVAPGAFASATRLLRVAPEPLQQTDQTLDVVPGASTNTLDILAALKPDLKPLTQAFTSLVDPVTNLSEHGCAIKQFAVNIRSLVSWGTLPGGPAGPQDGFPLTPVVSTQTLDNDVSAPTYPYSVPYPAPCSSTPGPALNEATTEEALTAGWVL